MKNMIFTLICASALAIGIGSQAAEAQQQKPAAQASTIPAALAKSAIATRSDKSGQIAAAQIGNSGTYIVYLKTANGCGTGGCRAQIWKKSGNGYSLAGKLPVGFLPIRQLGQTDSGMPRLGITGYDNNGKAVLYAVSYNGREYANTDWNNPLPANTGKVILSEAMLKSF